MDKVYIKNTAHLTETKEEVEINNDKHDKQSSDRNKANKEHNAKIYVFKIEYSNINYLAK